MEGKGTLMEPGEEAVVVAEGGHAWWKGSPERKKKKKKHPRAVAPKQLLKEPGRGMWQAPQKNINKELESNKSLGEGKEKEEEVVECHVLGGKQLRREFFFFTPKKTLPKKGSLEWTNLESKGY